MRFFLGRVCTHELTTAFSMRSASEKKFESGKNAFAIDCTRKVSCESGVPTLEVFLLPKYRNPVLIAVSTDIG
jgi:hypothetical protein